ncbi:MAG: TonB-dependent receptor [Kiritimatiellales bacterium]|nr:TonB-dependent receptor [Pontiella sp.]NNJ71328.1 TonB-dependent receptor [Kiritimatiellales bacterium]
MNNKQVLIAFAILASTAAAPAATNEIIITAPRIATPLERMSSSVSVVTEKDIENSSQRILPDLLQAVPGISMARSGGPGQQTSVYLRGAKPQHTLVLIDGVRMNGQLDLSGYDMANLQLNDVERIEILKGPQSTLYGSDAMAGVINIVTKTGQGEPKPYYDIEGGSQGTWRAATGVRGGDSLLRYSASISHYERQGNSARKNNTEKDGTQNNTVSSRLNITPTSDSEINLILRYIDATSDYDDGFGTAHNQFKYDSEQLITRAEAKALVLDDTLETKLGVSYLMIDRNEYGFAGAPTRGFFDAETLSADFGNTFYLHDDHTLLLGIDGYRDDYDFNDGFGDIDRGDLHNIGAFGTYQAMPLDALVLNLGIRYDDHSQFKAETTYQASGSYTLSATGTKIKGSFGTGFKAPSSYQLYSTFFGNPALDPETSRGWEAGLEQQLCTNRLSVGATSFNTRYKNLIDYNFSTFAFDNIAKARTKGVEVYTQATLLENLRLRIGYTYLDNDDLSGGSFTLRRPNHQIDADLNYAVSDTLNLNLYSGYIGSRDDVGGVSMDAYTLVNLAARYRIRENVEIYGRLENLLDEGYETVYGYNTDGISAYAGIKVEL